MSLYVLLLFFIGIRYNKGRDEPWEKRWTWGEEEGTSEASGEEDKTLVTVK